MSTEMVKVFGRRPSQIEREARGRRTETSQARARGAQVRRYGDLRILRWSRKLGQGVKLGSPWLEDGPDDGQTEAIFGGIQGEGCP